MFVRKVFLVFWGLLLVSCAKNEASREVWLDDEQSGPIYLQVDGVAHADAGKLAIIQHGLASHLGHSVVQTAKKAFLDNGYVVITFDSRNSLGKSGGNIKDVRLASFERDLAEVVDWVSRQDFYSEPFALVGHSLGGASVLQYTAENPSRVGKLIPVTPVVSGQKWEAACLSEMHDFCENWKKNGFYRYQTEDIPYQVVETAKAYDALKLADKIKADVLLVTAEDDFVIPPRDVEDLYDALSFPKHLVTVPQSGHNFETEENQQDLYRSIAAFLQSAD